MYLYNVIFRPILKQIKCILLVWTKIDALGHPFTERKVLNLGKIFLAGYLNTKLHIFIFVTIKCNSICIRSDKDIGYRPSHPNIETFMQPLFNLFNLLQDQARYSIQTNLNPPPLHQKGDGPKNCGRKDYLSRFYLIIRKLIHLSRSPVMTVISCVFDFIYSTKSQGQNPQISSKGKG